MAEHWSGIVSAANREYVKGAQDRTIRGRLWLSMMESRNLIRTGVDMSFESEYAVQYRLPPATSFGYGETAVYEPRDLLKRARMGTRGCIVTDEMHVKEYTMLANSTHNLVNRYREMVPNMVTSVKERIGEEIYIDGGAAGNEERFEGIETCCGSGGTVVAADLIAEPDDTYHELDTDLHQDGTWDSNLTTKPNAELGYDWPEGKGDAEFDFNSPFLIRTNSTSWGSGDADWATQCIPIVRRTAQWMRLTRGLMGDTLLLMLNGLMMTEFKEAFDDRVRIITPHKEAEDLGFPDTLNFEGVAIKAEYGVPASTGYMLVVENTELLFITDGMYETTGPGVMDQDSMSYKTAVFSFGNYKLQPHHIAKLYPFATT